ncbi:hypothetical protein WG906_17105, partial [Pedobacter sp. P351]|uniref:hypothetical protein n=1 Tax=Pedobacter superstes TaxID=3133441 RepID=UPI00309FDB40
MAGAAAKELSIINGKGSYYYRNRGITAQGFVGRQTDMIFPGCGISRLDKDTYNTFHFLSHLFC